MVASRRGRGDSRVHVLIYCWIYLTLTSGLPYKQPEVKPYCHDETFRASCSYDEVIVMQSAVYGRMRLGRCVKVNMGYIGCQKDVLDLADSRCSGRRKCAISIPDSRFEKTQPCLELKSYLEASYKCVKIKPLDKSLCRGPKAMRISDSNGYIASETTRETWCGASDNPWRIEALPGQRINISLVDFGGREPLIKPHYDHNYQNIVVCEKYGVIKEATPHKEMTVCGGKHRQQHLYLSSSNSVEIEMETKKFDPNFFLFKYEVVGCPDPELSPNGWFESQGNTIKIGCNNRDETWEMTCVGNTWLGEYGNCSDENSLPTGQKMKGEKKEKGFSTGAVVAVVCSLAFLLGAAGAILLGITIIRRRRKNPPEQPPTPVSPKTTQETDLGNDEIYLKPTLEGFSRGQQRQEKRSDYQKARQHPKNQYTHIWEMPLPKTP